MAKASKATSFLYRNTRGEFLQVVKKKTGNFETFSYSWVTLADATLFRHDSRYTIKNKFASMWWVGHANPFNDIAEVVPYA